MAIKELGPPSQYNLPSGEWRPRQDETALNILNMEPGQVLILEQACGYGKSYLPGIVSYFRRGTTTLVRTRDLQSQYLDLGSFVNVIWGQDHYSCVNPETIADFRATYGEDPTRADCPFSPVSECEYIDECEYEVIKKACLYARLKVANYHYAFFSQWWRRSTEDLFCDEAHSLPVTLNDLVSVELRKGLRDRYSLPDFPLARGGAPFMLKQAQAWSSLAARTLLPLTKSRDLKVKKRAIRLRDSLKGLEETLDKSEEAEWYVESKPGEGFLCKPVIPGAFARSLLIPQARSIVLMSATIGDPSVLASELGIENYEFATYPHIFPRSIRPVFWIKDSPRLSARSGDEDYKKQAEIIAKLLKGPHREHRGIVHTASWAHTKLLAGLLSSRGLEDRIYIPSGERVASINGFLKSPPGTVCLSPSMAEGISLDGDLGRFAIVAKMPFKSMGDPIVRLRLRRKGGNKWYRWQCALQVVQGCGRIVRGLDDWGTGYLVDSNWAMVKSYAPAWFEVEDVASVEEVL